MESTGQAKTTLFEHALDIGLGIFDAACDVASTSVEKPGQKSTNKPNKPKQFTKSQEDN